MRLGRRVDLPTSRLATRFFPTRSSSSAKRSSSTDFSSSRTIPIRFPSRSILRRGPSGRPSHRCATNASNICRRASCTSFYGGFHTDSNGCAAGNTRDEAIVQGFLELIERDAYAIWWYNRVQRAEVDLEQFDDFYVRDLQSQFAEAGRKLWVLDVTTDLGIPTYVAIMHWMQNGHEHIEFGSGAHFDRRIALLRSLTELTQFMSVSMMGGASGENPTLDGVTPLRLEDYPFLIPSDRAIVPPAPSLKLHDNTRDQAIACVEIAARAGYDFLVLDQTRPDVEVPVVRVLVPGLRHFYRRFAPGRLYDVPVKLGLLDRPRLESDLTPFLPHT